MFNCHAVCFQLSFVHQTMQHITVNLVLFKINSKCFYSNKDFLSVKTFTLSVDDTKRFAQGVTSVAGLYQRIVWTAVPFSNIY